MTRHLRIAALAIAVLALVAGCSTGKGARTSPPQAAESFRPDGQDRLPDLPRRPEDLGEPDSIAFTPPEPSFAELPNGIKLYILEDHTLPLVNVDVLVGNGSRYDPPGKTGLAGFTAQVMRRGGTRTFPGDALDDTLGFLAASLSVGMTEESATAGLNVLKKDFPTGLRILADVLMNPAFPKAKLEEVQRLTKESIRRRDDDPYEIARRKFRQLVYGKDSPYSRQLEIADVDRITTADMAAFHRQHFRPNVTWIAISGDIDRAEAVRMVREAFSGWQTAPLPPPTLPPTGTGLEKGVYVYPKDVTQSAIRMGRVGMPRHSADQYAVDVMNQIFGMGTFTSRLGLEVRSKRGLAYYVAGSVSSDPDPRQGMFFALAGTRVDKTWETIGVMRGIIDSMDTQPIADAELVQAKEAIINSFVFEYDSPAKIVGQQMHLAYQGYPPDYLRNYIENVRKVTSDEVLAAARTYLRADDLRIIVVGDPEKFERPLDTFGPVTVLTPDPTGEETARGAQHR